MAYFKLRSAGLSFVKLGFCQEGGCVGEQNREFCMPLPDHISASPNAY
jgi:hypothetical protein